MRALLLLALGLALATPATAQTWQLVWSDEFDGTSLDLSRWTPQIGTGCPDLCGWGNNELQYYRAENATVAGGLLTITARRENFGGAQYTSARLRTKNLGDWEYGRFEMRAKMPIGRGIWPAFWMLPTDGVYGGWAASGEIDIMEYLGHQPARVHGTLHYGGTWPANTNSSNAYDLPSGNFHDAFHTFALEWEPYAMRWYVDGQLYATQTSWYSTQGPYPAPFDQRFHLLLNLAVGGNWPGNPDGSTVFPQQYVVDYVRVYQLATETGCRSDFDDMEHGAPFANGWFQFNGSIGGGGIDPNFTDLPPAGGGAASLQTGWGSGGAPGYLGGFGRTRSLDLRDRTHFEFWIHPDAGQDYRLEVNLQDDDDGDGSVPGVPDGQDDEFQYVLSVGGPGAEVQAGGGWQKVSIPLSAFVDDNSYHYGGNGIFDPVPTSAGGNGMLANIVVTVITESGADATFRTDAWEFVRRESSLSGRVFEDLDGDGVDDGEPGMAGVTVELLDPVLGTVTGSDVTDATGRWDFGGLLDATHRVRVATSSLPAGSVPTVDPDGISSAHLADVVLDCAAAITDLAFGYRDPATDAPPAPWTVRLGQNVPNPFNPRTTIEFELAAPGEVALTVHDVAGRRLAELAVGGFSAGSHRVVWDGADSEGRRVAGGTYYYMLRAAGEERVRKMILLP